MGEASKGINVEKIIGLKIKIKKRGKGKKAPQNCKTQHRGSGL